MEPAQLTHTMSHKFVDLARRGRNEWWRWLLGLSIVLVAWLGSGFFFGMVLVLWVVMDNDPKTYIDAATHSIKGLDPVITYIAFNLGHAVMVVALFVVIRHLHRRSFLSLITPENRVRWDRVFKSFVLWFGLSAATTVVDYLLYPAAYKLVLNPIRFLIFVPLALILTPLQASGEELFFRGYVMQGLGLLTHNTFGIAAVVGLLFMAPHLTNPEVVSGFAPMAVYYFGVGFFLAFVTLRSNTLEYALGIHAATCLFSALVTNYENSVMPTESIFFCSVLNPWNNLIYFAMMILIFSLVMFRGNRQAPRVEP
jgi:uncharacterized protein